MNGVTLFPLYPHHRFSALQGSVFFPLSPHPPSQIVGMKLTGGFFILPALRICPLFSGGPVLFSGGPVRTGSRGSSAGKIYIPFCSPVEAVDDGSSTFIGSPRILRRVATK